MIAYIIRRLLYAIPILITVNVLTFILFFYVNSPDDIARAQLGDKRTTPEAVEQWKAERGYAKPLIWNTKESGFNVVKKTIFFDKSVRMMAFDFGSSDSGRDINHE